MSETVVEVLSETKSSSSIGPKDVLLIGVGFGLGYAFKHYRNVYLEWKRKKIGMGFIVKHA